MCTGTDSPSVLPAEKVASGNFFEINSTTSAARSM